jgi:hypothetical protein
VSQAATFGMATASAAVMKIPRAARGIGGKAVLVFVADP